MKGKFFCINKHVFEAISDPYSGAMAGSYTPCTAITTRNIKTMTIRQIAIRNLEDLNVMIFDTADQAKNFLENNKTI